MIENILSNYKEQLDLRAIRTKPDLVKIIRFDRAKIVWALAQLKNRSSTDLLNDFFAEVQPVLADIKQIVNNQCLYHVGFEIYEPLDLVLDGFEWGIRALNQKFTCHHIGLTEIIRFSASQALQKRVEAYVEMARVWITIDEQAVMVELFDIHRPVERLPELLPPKKRLSFERLLTPPISIEMPCELFAQDKIWHYALFLKQASDVLTLHRYFQSFTQSNPHYYLPFTEIVNNKQDGSFYTKIINRQKGLELEFVAEGQF